MLNLHIKTKHNGGTLDHREEVARSLIHAYALKKLTKSILESVDISLHPGLIQENA